METILTPVFISVPLLLGVLLVFYGPRSTSAAYLRRTALAAIIVFGCSIFILKHSALATMRQGDFWVVSWPNGYELKLRHPYDYYLIYQIPRWSFLATFPILVICSAAYFWKLRYDNRNSDPIQNP